MSETETSRRPFEQILEELEAVVTRLESGDLPLEEAILAFERGVRLTREGEQVLAQAEQRVERLLAERDGALSTQPFDADAEGAPRQ